MGNKKIGQSYGWVVVGLSFLTVAVSTAVGQSIIILFPEIQLQFHWSRTAISLAPALAGLTASLGSLLIGVLADRWDLRYLICAGAAFTAAALFLCSRLSQLWQFYLFYGVGAALGISCIGILPHNLIIANWFDRSRGTAIGIVSSGYGAGMLLFLPFLEAVISGGRWRNGFIFMACGLAGLAPLILLLQRSRPSPSSGDAVARAVRAGDPPTRASARLAVLLRRHRYWLTYIQFLLGPLSTTPVIVHQAALLRDRGMAGMQAAWLVGLFGLASFLGMICAGTLSDRMGREWTYTLGTLGLIAGCAALLLVRSGADRVAALAYAILFGFGFGTRPSMDAATAVDIFRGSHFGTVYGSLSTALGLGQLCGPLVSGLAYDTTGSYVGAILFSMAAVCAATLCIWLAAPRRGLEPA